MKKLVGTVQGVKENDFNSDSFIIELTKLFKEFKLDLKTISDYQSHNEDCMDGYVEPGQKFQILLQGFRESEEGKVKEIIRTNIK